MRSICLFCSPEPAPRFGCGVDRLPAMAGYDEPFIAEVARVMECSAAYELYRLDPL